MRVLLVEDEEAIAEAVRDGLEEERYTVDVATNGTEGLHRAAERKYAVILLDVMLPGVSGWDVCRTLRERRDLTPILMLTARGGLDDRVKGLDLGADDYLPKPFDFPELLARMRSLLRRDKMHRTRVIKIGDLTIDTGDRRVTRNGVEIRLSEREYTLLHALASHAGRALSREYIQENVWGDEESFSNTVDAFVHLLRKKVDAGHAHKLIETVHGIGYALRAEPEGAGR
jgi:two-component system copper resistance phosphate regulon response regulator CusR